MSTHKEQMPIQYLVDGLVHIPLDLGSTGKAKADIDLIKKAVDNGSFDAVPAGDYALKELGNNLYVLTVSGTSVSSAHEGVNTLLVSGSGLDRNEIVFGLKDQNPDSIYDAINAGTLKAQLQNDAVDVNVLKDDAITAAKIATDAIDADAVKADAASKVATAVWASGTRTLTSFGTLIADIWSYGSRTLSSLGSSAVSSVWNKVLADLTGAGTIGKAVADNIDAPISTVDTVVDAIKAKTDQLSFGSSGVHSEPVIDISMSTADKDDIVDKVLDEAVSDHVSAGTVGNALRLMRGALGGLIEVTGGGATMTIKDEDEVTLLKTFTLTYDASGDNVTERDPS